MAKLPILPEPIPDEWLKKLHNTRRLTLARKCFYESSLNRYKRWDKGLKVLLALSSSTVAGLAIWNILFPQNVVTYISTIAAAITAIIGVLQPIFGLSEKIDESRELLGNYKRGVVEFDELEFMILRDKMLTLEEFKKMYAANMRGIGNAGPTTAELTAYCSNMVNDMLPEENWRIEFISPKETIAARGG